MEKETRLTVAYIALGVAMIAALGTCEGREETGIKDKGAGITTNWRERHYEDSLRMVEMGAEIVRLNDVREVQDSVIEILNCRLSTTMKPRWKEIATASNTNDTVRLADTIINLQDSVIETQRRDIALCDSTTDALGKMLDVREGTMAEYEYNMEEMENALAKARKGTWWTRNKGWVMFASGVIVGTLTIWGTNK